MRVVTPSGESIALGTTETGATIGIIDYSRRVTDDFGVTTVVERGFARKMSVRLAVPSPDVDALQRRLAELRATSALWVADERYASLQVQGFYKDFQIDLPGTSVSFCSMSIEGIASSAAAVDAGGDPAPDDRASTLQLLQPVTVTDAVLAVSSVPETDAPAWDAATPYPIGARVIRGSTHRIYESLASGNLGNDPAAPAGRWLDLGPTNRWAMFDQALGTVTTAAGAIVVTLDAGTAGAVALLDVKAATVRVQALGYDRTVQAGAGTLTFLDLPAGPVNVRIAGDGAVSVGTLLIGRCVGLGITEASPTAGITDFSRKVVDDFGEVTVVERAWAKRMTAKALIRTDALDVVASRIAGVRARPCLWIGQSGLDSLTIYGFFKDFSVEVADGVSKLSLSIEGLSKAAPITPLGVNWEDVRDSNPAKPKPADGATNTADPNSSFGPDKNVGDVLYDLTQFDATIAAAQESIRELDEVGQVAAAAVDAVKLRADALEVSSDASIEAALRSIVIADAERLAREAGTLVDGQKIKVVVRQEVVDRQLGEARTLDRFDILGIFGQDGQSVILNLDRVKLGPSETMASRLSTINVSLGTTAGKITALEEITTNGTLITATRFNELALTVGGADGAGGILGKITNLETITSDGTFATATALRNLTLDVAGEDGTGGLKGRIGNLEQITTNGTFASVSDLETLELIIVGPDGTEGLRGKITDLEQITTDGTFATATDLDLLELEFKGPDGTGGIKGEIADLREITTDGTLAKAIDLETLELEVVGPDGTGGVKGAITDLKEIIVDPDPSRGIVAKAVFGIDVDGYVVGRVETNDGTVGTLTFRYDNVTFLGPNGNALFVIDANDPLGVYAPNFRVGRLVAETVTEKEVSFGATGQMSLYDRAASNDNSQTTFTGFMGVGIVSRDGSPMTGFVSFHAQNIGSPNGAAYYRIVRVQDGHVVWGGANGLPIAVSPVGQMMAWGFSDSVPIAAEAQYDVQVRCTGGANIRSSARHEEITERVRTAFTQIWISAPPGEGPGAGAGGGGQINGDSSGDGGTTGTTTNNPSGVGGLRQKQFEEIP
ncbi:hypothetical protein ACFSGX_15130 [Sphingomonas arantia]|uniref:DUF1983 domain-containing protein n=1 Tax=Sphingomonas arantia TaxID=1460676 RepID=A0ABW4U1Y2_9SPHN